MSEVTRWVDGDGTVREVRLPSRQLPSVASVVEVVNRGTVEVVAPDGVVVKVPAKGLAVGDVVAVVRSGRVWRLAGVEV